MLSRVADSLYWMSRYIERAENNARIAEVNLQLLARPRESAAIAMCSSNGTRLSARLRKTNCLPRSTAHSMARPRLDFVSLQEKNPNSISSCLRSRAKMRAPRANKCRARCGNKSIGCICLCKAIPAESNCCASPYEFFKHIVVGSHLFQGITDATMTHGEGWDFIRIGRFLERADCSSRILDVKYHILLPSGERVGGNVDTVQWMAVLKSCSALEAYRKIYVDQVAPWKVAEFIITHAEFPRSIRFSVDSLDSALHRISGSSEAEIRQ